MPPQKRTAAAKGRRDPALLAPDTGPQLTGDPMIDEELGQDELEASHADRATDPDEPDDVLLFAGDIVTANVTLAVDITGNGKTDFVGYRATTRVQPGEDHADVFGRVAEVVGDGVVSEAHDAAQRWAEYEAAMENERQELLRVTGGQQ